MAAASSWKDKLAGDMPPLWAEQIDEFEAHDVVKELRRLLRGGWGKAEPQMGERLIDELDHPLLPACIRRPAPRAEATAEEEPYVRACDNDHKGPG